MSTSTLMKRLSIATAGASVVAASLAVTTAPAQAFHLFFDNVRINGVSLENETGLTNPTITNSDGLFTFEIDAFNSEGNEGISDILLSFTEVGGTSDTMFLSYNGNGTRTSPETLSFTESFTMSANEVDGLLTVDVIGSGDEPDYIIPSSGQQVNGRTFTFKVNTITPVPEPNNVLLNTLEIGAFLGTGLLLKRGLKKKKRVSRNPNIV